MATQDPPRSQILNPAYPGSLILLGLGTCLLVTSWCKHPDKIKLHDSESLVTVFDNYFSVRCEDESRYLTIF